MINEKSEEFSNSQFALKAYMDFKDSNAYMHEAMVLFSVNGKSTNGIFKIYPKIDTNISFIEIIGNDPFSRDLKSRYTNKEFFMNSFLLVWGIYLSFHATITPYHRKYPDISIRFLFS